MKAPEELFIKSSRANSCLEPTPPRALHQDLQVEDLTIKMHNFSLSKSGKWELGSASQCLLLPISITLPLQSSDSLGLAQDSLLC